MGYIHVIHLENEAQGRQETTVTTVTNTTGTSMQQSTGRSQETGNGTEKLGHCQDTNGSMNCWCGEFAASPQRPKNDHN